MLFKDIFYKILVKIYYGIFKLKKNELANNAVSEVSKNHLVYFFVFSLTTLFVFANLIDQSKAGSLEIKISKTVVAALIPADLGARPDEELIKESGITANSLMADRKKNQDNSSFLDKQDGLISVDDDDTTSLAFNDSGDMIIKPLFTGAVSSSADTPAAQRTETIYYTVQNGDAVSTIARRFGITVNTILWSNNLNSFSLIRPGDSLAILPTSGILYTVKSGDTITKVAAKYGVDVQKVLSANNISAGLKAGQKIILPGAKKLSEQSSLVARTQSKSGLSVISNLIKAPAVKAGGGKMAWPTGGYRITQYFSWRHNGVDIGNKVGTPIYAADDGVVEISQGGYNGGYGNTIVINHGGGYKTRYGHASKLFVKVGDVVEKGENIAAMGSTGRSTGSHLHFEVLINGIRYNPLNYIK